MLLGKGVPKICSKFKEHPCRRVISTKLLCKFIKITLRQGCSPVNLLHIFGTPFRKNTSGWLLLYISTSQWNQNSSSTQVPGCSITEVRNDANLWQWTQMKIKLYAFLLVIDFTDTIHHHHYHDLFITLGVVYMRTGTERDKKWDGTILSRLYVQIFPTGTE